MELLVRPSNRRLAFSSGSNLLDVLRKNEVPVSYSCMSGRCGTCRCRVIDGDIIDEGPEAGRPNLIGERHVLACQSVLTGNCAIEILEADEIVNHPARIIKGTVVGIEPVTHDIIKLRMRLAKPLEFSPGQYATLQFSPDHARPYSMAGLPSDEEMAFHIRKVPGGRVTEYIFSTIKAGAAIKVSGPLGTAYLRRTHTGPMLCVGGGTGLAPVLSIVRGAIEAGMRNPVHLYFGVRSEADLYNADDLQALAASTPNLTVHIVIASGKAGQGQRSGLVTDAIEHDLPDLNGWRAYLCGAPAMVEALSLLVTRLGINPSHVHADAFYPSGT
ncbi:2Fe-2S iron-sulfur cluster binding domain-containing protein [Azoarcus sp. L1K30]|uniref:2Fe-2S iron-sulfur cluster-binding protein n=1 Tax=Azoarcus sp. L1K30 TaxID=2820277 RepID=UPI001B8460E6|nr:2Fe-2S iron-sulfur cluster-binding protein [Azoarcus sp. L1K30]MBR0566165.1 2Fe-2S iron-sulfur cluster binding domain-containing protein [Azoarcus sp. L1K30]